jgi:hypothetical protein
LCACSEPQQVDRGHAHVEPEARQRARRRAVHARVELGHDAALEQRDLAARRARGRERRGSRRRAESGGTRGRYASPRSPGRRSPSRSSAAPGRAQQRAEEAQHEAMGERDAEAEPAQQRASAAARLRRAQAPRVNSIIAPNCTPAGHTLSQWRHRRQKSISSAKTASGVEALLGHRAHQVNAPARARGLVAREAEGRAGLQAQAAVDAVEALRVVDELAPGPGAGAGLRRQQACPRRVLTAGRSSARPRRSAGRRA